MLKYRFRPQDAATGAAIEQLQAEGMPGWLAALCAARGVKSSKEAHPKLSDLLHFESMLNMDAVARRIAQAIENTERIVVVGDYDADGATATAVAVLGLRMLGAKDPGFVVPDRFKHGYGLSPAVVDLAAEQAPNLIITVDNGIAALQGIAAARKRGIDVVVTDHHLAGDRLPDTPWIVNPNQPGCRFEGKNTAGVGVMFYTLLATRAVMLQAGKWPTQDKPALEVLLDLVALGTVADVVRLDANNRSLVSAGISRIRRGASRPLIKHLFEVSRRQAAHATSSDLAFYVGPRINAAGRMEDMAMGIQGLLCDDDLRAKEIAATLDTINRERKHTQKQMEEEASQMLADAEMDADASGIVLYKRQWHEGVIGLLASRVKERRWRPALVFCDDHDGNLKGSGRSVPGLHLRDAIDWLDRLHPDVILKFGGHAMAAGLTIRKEYLDVCREAFDQICAERLGPEALQNCLMLDAPPEWEDVHLKTALQIEQMAWGQGFEEPVFGGILPLRKQDVIKDAHLKLEIDAGAGRVIKGICFNRVKPIDPLDVCAWKLVVERWKDREMPSIRVVDILPRL